MLLRFSEKMNGHCLTKILKSMHLILHVWFLPGGDKKVHTRSREQIVKCSQLSPQED